MKKMMTVVAGLAMTLMCSSAWAEYNFSKNPAEAEEVETTPPAATAYKAVSPVVSQKVSAAPAAAPAVPAPAQSAVPEALEKFKAIESQVQWVAKLKKQLDGETSQLNEMRRSMAQSFGLDAKKLENDRYKFDARSGKFVEK